MSYHVEITTPGKPGELRNQIQGLVGVPPWEFDSPLRHQISRAAAKWLQPFIFRAYRSRSRPKNGAEPTVPHHCDTKLVKTHFNL